MISDKGRKLTKEFLGERFNYWNQEKIDELYCICQ